MTTETIIKTEQFVSKLETRQWNWWHLFAVIFMSVGFFAIIVGQILTLVMWLFHQEIMQFSLQNITNLLFYVSFPLLFLGACCLDKVDEKHRKNETGLNG